SDLCPEGPCVVGHEGCAGQTNGTGEVLYLLCQPKPQVRLAGPRICSWLNLAQQDAGSHPRDNHASQRTHKNQPRSPDPPPGNNGGCGEPSEIGQKPVGSHEVGQPPHSGQDVQWYAHEHLEEL